MTNFDAFALTARSLFALFILKNLQNSIPVLSISLKMDEAVDILLESGCMIYGSYIYKRMLLGEVPNDVDAVGVCSAKVYSWIHNLVRSKYFKIDISKPDNFDSFMRYTSYPCFINSVGLRKEKGHIDFVPAASSVTPSMVDYVIDNLSERRYCRWPDMREKDIKFFKDFEVIPTEECELHGFFQNVHKNANNHKYQFYRNA